MHVEVQILKAFKHLANKISGSRLLEALIERSTCELMQLGIAIVLCAGVRACGRTRARVRACVRVCARALNDVVKRCSDSRQGVCVPNTFRTTALARIWVQSAFIELNTAHDKKEGVLDCHIHEVISGQT